MVLLMDGISGYFVSAVGAFFLLLFFFFFLYTPEICSRWKAIRLHGENADTPGCQHPQSDQSPQRQLPFFAAGPLDHQRRLAGLSEVSEFYCLSATLICISVHFWNGWRFFYILRTQPRCLNCSGVSLKKFYLHSWHRVVRWSTLLNDTHQDW